MNCNECFEAFSSALDGELDPAEQSAMTEHLEDCQDCQRLQTKMLALSAELKAQPFPQVPEQRVVRLASRALEGAQASRLGWLRRVIRLPYENWALRASLRTLSFSTLAFLVFCSGLVRHLLPSYGGVEAVAKSGLPHSSDWWAIDLSQSSLLILAGLTLIIGLWVAGLPGFLLDLWTEAKLGTKNLVRLGLGALCLGPVVALPLLASLELGNYILASSLWAGACLIITYVTVAFKTPRPLPRLAIDFVILVLLVGSLEWLARASQSLPTPQDLNVTISLLVGSVPFPTLGLAMGCLLFSFVTFCLGLTTAIPSYRAAGGRLLAVLFFVVSAGLGTYSVQTLNPLSVSEPIKAAFKGERKAYLLGSSKDNIWVLSSVDYPSLEVNVVGSETAPRAARLRLLSAYLEWDEQKLLNHLTDWANGAPGVTWGLASFVDQLGERQQNVLSVPNEARAEAVKSLLDSLRWRILDKVELASETAVVKGKILGLRGEPLAAPVRLIRLQDEENIKDAVLDLAIEHQNAEDLVKSDQLDSEMGLVSQRTVIPNAEGEFSIPRLAAGRYVLSVLLPTPAPLTLNPSIPGIFQVSDGQVLEVPPIRLTAGTEGKDISLALERWETTGAVAFSENSEVTTARLETGSSITGFVETDIYAGGKGRLKILTESEAGTKAKLRAIFYAKSGRVLKDWTLDLSGKGGPHELQIDGGKEPGYLQLKIESSQGQVTVQSLKWEAL